MVPLPISRAFCPIAYFIIYNVCEVIKPLDANLKN